ncbi:hypothetical protein [Spirosoma endophyticum]|uniref:Uncharacterized protein n=1 Tax=Spirosoma endophyticum TaxID=662367 RepID=A0A1I1SC92_9BACT|nr:hypothetical protein [Spirosoma endophyticum]SFD44086.1 hypothetical protein SAMN05216167_10552 [Spirosoma endophyticum]
MKKNQLPISLVIIWTSSIFLGLLSSVPQRAAPRFNPAETAVNAGVTVTFALLMWYVNMYTLSQRPQKTPKQTIPYPQLNQPL